MVRFKLQILLICFYCGIGMGLAVENLPEVKGFKVGMEVELRTSRFAKLIRFFDLRDNFRYSWTLIPPHEINAFLDEGQNFDLLSDRIRSQIDQKVEISTGDRLSHKQIWRAWPIERKVKSLLEEKEGIPAFLGLPGESLAAMFVEDIGVLRTKLDWIQPTFPVGTSQEIKELFSRLAWMRETNFRPVMEFVHDKPITSLQQYKRDLKLFGNLIRENDSEDPLRPTKKDQVSYHVHVSRNKNVSDEFLHLLNLQRLLYGGADVAEFYSDDLEMKGLIRRIKENHFELRSHIESAEAEIEDMYYLMGLKENAALEVLEKRVLAILTLDNLKIASSVSAVPLMILRRLLKNSTLSKGKIFLNQIEIELNKKQIHQREQLTRAIKELRQTAYRYKEPKNSASEGVKCELGKIGESLLK